MEEKELKNIINKAIDTQGLDYEPKDRTKENEVLIAKLSKPRKTRRFIFAIASSCAVIIIIAVISIPLLLDNSQPPSSGDVFYLPNVREAYPNLVYPNEDFQLKEALLKKDKQDRYIHCKYESSDYKLSVVITFYGYIHESNPFFTDICVNETEKNGHPVFYGNYDNNAYASFEIQGNKYLLTLYSASPEQILNILENFS